MFGDIGQGAIFLIAGIILSKKIKKGMMQKIGSLFIPMGIAAIIFGILYDSIFLVEGLLFHHHQFMPSPIHETSKLMKWVFTIAAIEVVFGLTLGAINQIKAKNPIGALGEHGLGMIIYVIGLYLSAIYFINIGLDFMPVLSHWTFYMALIGMGLSFIEPILHSITHGHGIGMESIGEGVSGLLMTFVEGLANLFSFLRIAAFALAHASLAVAAVALTHSLGITGIGLVIMNIVALSFEFVSSSVQSLRLLYYEFMGKFYSGEGIPFSPFKIRARTERRLDK
jgi:V/A-type H+-transporting ATPase subunit I